MKKEKTITINFRKVFEKPMTKRAKSALFVLKSAVKKETRKDNIKISNKVNEALWNRGLFKSLRKITVKIVIDKDTRVYLPDEKIIQKEEKQAKTLKEKVESKKEETNKETKTKAKKDTKKEEVKKNK